MLGRVSLPSEVRPLVTVAVVPPATQPAAPPGVSAAVPQRHTGTGPTSSVAGTATLREQVAGGRASGSGRVRDADGSARRGLAPAAAEPATRRPPGSVPEEDALAAATRRVDLLSQVTRLLLDEQSLSEPVTLHRVAWLLQADAAAFGEAVQRIDGRLRDEIGRLEASRKQIAQLAAGDSLVVPPEVSRYLDRLREIGASERIVQGERDGWILVAARWPAGRGRINSRTGRVTRSRGSWTRFWNRSRSCRRPGRS